MQLQFYPYDFEYKIRDKKVYVYLYSKLETGERICVMHQYQPYFFAQVHNLDKEAIENKLTNLTVENKSELAKVISWEVVEKELLGKKEQFWKIHVNYPQAVPLIRILWGKVL